MEGDRFMDQALRPPDILPTGVNLQVIALILPVPVKLDAVASEPG